MNKEMILKELKDLEILKFISSVNKKNEDIFRYDNGFCSGPIEVVIASLVMGFCLFISFSALFYLLDMKEAPRGVVGFLFYSIMFGIGVIISKVKRKRKNINKNKEECSEILNKWSYLLDSFLSKDEQTKVIQSLDIFLLTKLVEEKIDLKEIQLSDNKDFLTVALSELKAGNNDMAKYKKDILKLSEKYAEKSAKRNAEEELYNQRLMDLKYVDEANDPKINNFKIEIS